MDWSHMIRSRGASVDYGNSYVPDLKVRRDVVKDFCNVSAILWYFDAPPPSLLYNEQRPATGAALMSLKA